MQTPWRTAGSPDLANSVHRWMPSDTEDNWISRGRPSIYDDTSFDYRYNQYGFRCDSMADPLAREHRVIWAGCSVTEGIGLPADRTWSSLMTNRLRQQLNDHTMPYWCVARGGCSQDWVARQLCMMIPLLRPQVVVAHLPEPTRRELWWDGQLERWYPGHERTRLTERVVSLWSDAQIIHDSQRAVMLIYNTCRAYDVLLRWHMWMWGGPNADTAYQQIREGLPGDVQCCHYLSAPGGGDIARDGLHGGPQTHAVFADALWDEIGADLLARLR